MVQGIDIFAIRKAPEEVAFYLEMKYVFPMKKFLLHYVSKAGLHSMKSPLLLSDHF